MCDATTTPVRFVSIGLASDKNLSDLIDFTTPGSLKANAVTVSENGVSAATTASSVWWSNPVAINNSGGSLASVSTIYLITSNTAAAYTLDADKVALVIQPGVTLTGPGTSTDVVYSLNNQQLWVEGSIDASGNNNGVYLSGVRFSILRHLVTDNAGYRGVFLDTASNNTLIGVTANNGYYGVVLSSATNNTLIGVTANNGYYGIDLESGSNNNTLTGVTASNNGNYGVVLSSATDNTFTGLLKVGTNGAGDCYVTGGTNPGLSNSTCANNGTSNVSLITSTTLAASFVGKVTSDDTQNTSDTVGAATYPADPTTFDWSHFDNIYRSWGLDDGSVFPSTGQQGTWTNGSGTIWDWSLLASDTVIKDVLTLLWSGTPAPATDASCNVMVPGSTYNGTSGVTTFLAHAVEILNTGGNNNGLCETGETCLYTPNIGSYQGRGKLISAGTFTAGTTAGALTGITLMQFDTNGEPAQP